MPAQPCRFRSLTRRPHHHHRRRRNPAAASASAPPPTIPTYMRNTIQSISSLLRDQPWDLALPQLRSLPVRWDSFTINQVLKTHPPMHKSWLFFNWASTLPRSTFRHDKYTYTTMLDIFGEAGRVDSMRHLIEHMRSNRVEVDHVTMTAAMHWMAKAGDVDGAVGVWEEMRRGRRGLTVVSYTAMVKILLDCGREEEAAGVYREMVEVGLKPNCRTYTVLMEFLAGAGKFKAALEIMSKMQDSGIQPDKATCNILVQKCSNAGEISVMTQILLYMKENSIVLRRPIFLEALEALRNSGKSDTLLREVNPHLAFEGIEEDMSELEAIANDTSSLIDRGIVINLLARKDFIAMEHMLSGMVDKETQLDSELISSVVQANCMNHRVSGAQVAFDYCLKTNKKLHRSAYISLLGLFIRNSSFQKIMDVVDEMVKSGISLGTYLVSLMINRLGCAGLTASATKVFQSFPTDHNVVTYTAMINVHLQAGEVDKGLELYSRMRKQGIPVSLGTYEVLIVGLEGVGRILDAEIYRKEKKRLQWRSSSLDRYSVEESLCNRLYCSGQLSVL
ncbi:putative LRR receptor-like serine/threonine-protein kinase [Iris pallida]|uniref:LRR receptor-like serine/threonine-protein kinase n=1 Tax=Iris pallida TaxID=29817 RepID=A0AAX6FF70_IRIPA|nr:putative LRR receptor-like serine/threonine-protein kinase [Iris pallida]